MDLKAFSGDEHLPFRIDGDGSLALLLIHGFPGTPAEMRPIRELVRHSGITIEAPLLPGFGHQISTIANRTRHEWIKTVEESLSRLRLTHRRVILTGFSMGGALAIHAAAGDSPPDHLLLLAPFWQLGERWHQPLWPLVRLLMPEFKPFARANLDDPQVQKDLRRSMPEADLNDSETREAIRRLAIPVGVIDQLRSLGGEAWKIAPRLSVPITIVQGSRDPIVPPHTTRRLVKRIGVVSSYLEVDAEHQLIDPTNQSWREIAGTLLDLIEQFRTDVGHQALCDLDIYE